jgi:hypothetical protein
MEEKTRGGLRRDSMEAFGEGEARVISDEENRGA